MHFEATTKLKAKHSVTLFLFFGFSQAVEKLVQGAESGCPTDREKQVVLNCTRILTRILPYIFEDQDWRGFFWSTVPGAGHAGVSGKSGKLGVKTMFI